MKKTKKYILYTVLLILAIFNLNTVMNILVYNSMLNAIAKFIVDEMYLDSFKLLIPILIVLFNFLISFIFAGLISKTEDKDLESDNDEFSKNKRKESIIFSSIYGLSFIVFNIIFYLKYIKNLSIIIEKFLEYSLWDLSESFIYYAVPKINVLVICLNCLTIIPAIIRLNTLNKKTKKKVSILKFVKAFGISIFALVLLVSNMYFYIDIPEFKYVYYTYSVPKVKEEIGIEDDFVELLGFSDYMRNFKEEMVIPDKIWGKDVFYLEGFQDDNVYLPGNATWDEIRNIVLKLLPNSIDKNYILIGSQSDWLIEDNQLYNKDKTEMIIRNPKNLDFLHIPATVEKISNGVTWIQMLEKDIVVEDENKYFYSYDGAVYVSFSNYNSLNELDKLDNTNGINDIICIVPKNKENIRLKDDISGEIIILGKNVNNVIVPSTLENEIEITGIFTNIVVEENNPLYTSQDGCLYNKDLTKLITFVEDDKREYKIPASLQEFNIRALTSLFNSDVLISIDEDNQYFTYENNVLYNKDKTKVIFTKINKGEYNYDTQRYDSYTEILDRNIEIDHTFKWYCNENAIEIKYKNELDEAQ